MNSIDYLVSLIDKVGIIQHCHYSAPNKKYGYSIDDNARAFVLLYKLFQLTQDDRYYQLSLVLLRFIKNQQLIDGRFRNYLHNETKPKKELADDGFGQTIWALGYFLAAERQGEQYDLAFDIWGQAMANIDEGLSVRIKAYSLLGVYEYLLAFPRDNKAEKVRSLLIDALTEAYVKTNENDWHWFEQYLSYGNAILPYSLLITSQTFKKKQLTRIGTRTLDFLLSQTNIGGIPAPIGSNGWYVKGGKRALFDQQPIDAGYTVLACLAAYRATSDKKYLDSACKWLDWFHGYNLLQLPLIDVKTGGCYDGLRPNKVNKNMGAESIVCYLLADLEYNHGNF